MPLIFHFKCTSKFLQICFNLDQSKILSSGNELRHVLRESSGQWKNWMLVFCCFKHIKKFWGKIKTETILFISIFSFFPTVYIMLVILCCELQTVLLLSYWISVNYWFRIDIVQYIVSNHPLPVLQGLPPLNSEIFVNPFPHNDSFWHPWKTSLLKTLWEKEKLLVTSNFSFSHSVFYPFG